MRRFWIVLRTELKAWLHDPVTAAGGLLPPLFILIAFSLMFGGKMSFSMAFVNRDHGPLGAELERSIRETLSPFGSPYYLIRPMSGDEAFAEFERYGLDALWIVPEDFTERLQGAEEPCVEMYFHNYIDDLAKNHRIYQAEIMWNFYRRVGLPGPPMEMAEEYPLPEMVPWFSIIAVGIALVSFILGGMINIMMLTYKEQVSRITLQYALMPYGLGSVFLAKFLLALLMSLTTGTIFLGILTLFGCPFPASFLPRIWLLSGLVSLFWIGAVFLAGLRVRHYMGAMIAIILTSLFVFFIGGGLSMIRNNAEHVVWFAWIFPNTYAVDPLRDMILFASRPEAWDRTLLSTGLFAAFGTGASWAIAARRIRRIG